MRKADYRSIQQLATTHILRGGGVLPSDEVHEFDPITTIAIAAFGAARADLQFDRSIAGLERKQHEEIYNAAWDLVCAYQDAAYAFGAAVGLQLHGLPATLQGDEKHDS
ncbi:MAG: hypothetical protein ABJA98_10500 [Acidobacteriota bacterium]